MTLGIADLTKGEVAGTGVFDILMRTVTSQLDSQYQESKITGSDYANVYLGSITATLQQSIQYLLGYERLNQELILIQKQIEATQANADLIKAQILKMNADTAVSTKQLDVMDGQISQMVAQVKLTNEQVNNVLKDIEVKTESIVKTKADTAMVTQQTSNLVNQDKLVTKQQDKIDAENLILGQKLITEKAQTEGTELTVQGIIGKQMKLIDKQAEGFDRNAEQKLVKMMIDTWTVRQTTDGADTATNGLADSEINNVLNIAKSGIGAPTFG